MNVWPKSNKLFPSVQTFHTHNCLFFRQSGYSEGIFKRLISPSESLDRRMSGSPSMAIPRPRLLRVCLLDGRLTVSPGMDKRLLRQGAPRCARAEGGQAGGQVGGWLFVIQLFNIQRFRAPVFLRVIFLLFLRAGAWPTPGVKGSTTGLRWPSLPHTVTKFFHFDLKEILLLYHLPIIF